MATPNIWTSVDSDPTANPIVILTSGQSNFEANTPFPAFEWTPSSTAQIWDGGREGVTGSSFTALDSTTIILPAKLASDIAAAFPGRRVYVINVVQSGTSITHWVNAGSPDVFQTILNNVPAALAACGAETINLFAWWQGESDTADATYISNFAALTSRLWAQSWFPQETPMLIFGLATAAQSGSAGFDNMNNVLQSIVNVDPAKRKFVYPADLSGTTYWQAIPNLHMTPQGYYSAGSLAAAAFLNGTRRTSPPGVIVDAVTGNMVFGKPAFASVPYLFNQNTNLTAPAFTGAGSLMEQFVAADGDTPHKFFDSFGGFSAYVGRRANGTSLVKTALATDDIIVSYSARGYDGTNYSTAKVSLALGATEGWTATHRGTFFDVYLTPTATDTIAKAVRFKSGSISVFGTTSGTGTMSWPAVLGTPAWVMPTNSGTFAVSVTSPLVLDATTGNMTITGVTGSLSGTIPAWPNNTTTFFRGDGTYAAVAMSSLSGAGTGVLAALAINVGSAGAPVLFNGTGGTPSSLTLTNATGLPTTGLTGALQAAQEPAHTGDVTNSAGSLALTLATVNSNVGSFGTATQAPQVTYDGKGRATAVVNVTITPAIGSVTGLGTGVATFLATPSSANFAAAITDEDGTGVVALEATGTWTPTDQSGAALTFTSINCRYTRIGNIAHAYGVFTFPSTASGSTLLIGGLPFTVANASYAAIPSPVKAGIGGSTAPVVAMPVINTQTFNIFSNGSGANITNATLTLTAVAVNISYPIT